MVSFEPSEIALSGDGRRLYVLDYRWPLVATAELSSLSFRVLTELAADTLAVGRSGGLTCADPDVVVAPAAGDSLIRIDPAGAVTVVPAPASPRVLIRQRTRVLGISHGSGVLTVLENGADTVMEVTVGISLTGLAATGQWTWVTDDADGSVSVLNADSFEVAHRFGFPGARAGGVCAGGNRAFVQIHAPGSRLVCLDVSGRQLWERPLSAFSGPSVTDGATVWTAGRLIDPEPDPAADLSADPVTSIDVSRFWPPEPTPLPTLSAEQFREQFLVAVIAEMATPGTAYDSRTDRPIGPTNPVARGFTYVQTLLDVDDVVVTFHWHDDPTVYGLRAHIDGLTHSSGAPTPAGAAGVLAVSLAEFLDTGGVGRARRTLRAGYVELTDD